MNLEDQITALAALGLTLNPGVTTDDLLYSWPRAEYERAPFDLILFMLGVDIEREPWGRRVSECAWNLDMECIGGPGSYTRIVQGLAVVAGATARVTDIADHVDFESEQAWVRYTIDGTHRTHEAAVHGDWADPKVVTLIMQDLERPGRTFYGVDNGQSSIWFYLDAQTAEKLNALTGDAFSAYYST